MKKQILSIVAISGVVAFVALNYGGRATSGSNFLQANSLDQLFARYMAKYGKSYATKEEYEIRKMLFERQLEVVAEQNSRNGATYQVAVNQFSDLTDDEFESRYLGDSGEPEITADTVVLAQPPVVKPIDWRTLGAVGPVKDQGHCGSCWSFSTVGPIEEHYTIKYGKQLVFAEQQLVDCSWPYGNNGCGGGLFANGYAYVKQYGLQLNSSYPYVANDTECQYDESQVAVRISGTISAIRSADGLKAALMNGPASISLYASDPTFRQYKSGVYNNADCPTSVNHAVQTVGWGTDAASGLDYFIVRNSWGPSWGDEGYIRIAETNTDLGICGMLYRVPMQPIIV